jgi:DNA-binding transcriptional LysR family regulator
MIMDRLTAMEVLVRAIETGSFSGAARQLGIGQPAVSKTIAQLEGRLGVSLLLRPSRGPTPTEAGQKLLQAPSARSRRRTRRRSRRATRAPVLPAGCASARAIPFGRLHIIPRLPLFLATRPELTVEAVLDDRDVDLIEKGIDVGFRMGTLADSAMVAALPGKIKSPKAVY